MLTFDTELREAQQMVLRWPEKGKLQSVTVIRDVFAKLTFYMETVEKIDQPDRDSFYLCASGKLGNFFSGTVYWDKPKKGKRTPQPVLDIIKDLRHYWDTKEGIEFYLSERAIAKKAWVQQAEQQPVWPYEETIAGISPKVVTFYSFKGGMGRTTTLAAVALQMVRKGKNVMMVDTDIEAPGLASLFFDESRIEKGVLDYLIEHPLNPEQGVARYVQDVTEPALLREEDGHLYLMPAGKVDGGYLQKLARIDYQDHRNGALREALEGLLKEIRREYAIDYILIDARAGFHDMGGIVAAQLPHGVVLFGNGSRQSWEGLALVLQTISAGHRDIMPVALADCLGEVQGGPLYLEQRERFLQKAYTVCLDYYYENDVPGMEAQNVAHMPVSLPYNSLLRGDVL